MGSAIEARQQRERNFLNQVEEEKSRIRYRQSSGTPAKGGRGQTWSPPATALDSKSSPVRGGSTLACGEQTLLPATGGASAPFIPILFCTLSSNYPLVMVLNIFDVENCVLVGNIIERQKDSETGEWKYRIEGRSKSGKMLEVITKISPTGKMVIITVYKTSIL
jgi:hypothetical protein